MSYYSSCFQIGTQLCIDTKDSADAANVIIQNLLIKSSNLQKNAKVNNIMRSRFGNGMIIFLMYALILPSPNCRALDEHHIVSTNHLNFVNELADNTLKKSLILAIKEKNTSEFERMLQVLINQHHPRHSDYLAFAILYQNDYAIHRLQEIGIELSKFSHFELWRLALAGGENPSLWDYLFAQSITLDAKVLNEQQRRDLLIRLTYINNSERMLRLIENFRLIESLDQLSYFYLLADKSDKHQDMSGYQHVNRLLLIQAWLKEHRALIHSLDKQNNSLLMQLIQQPRVNVDVALLLIEHGIDTKQHNQQGLDALTIIGQRIQAIEEGKEQLESPSQMLARYLELNVLEKKIGKAALYEKSNSF